MIFQDVKEKIEKKGIIIGVGDDYITNSNLITTDKYYIVTPRLQFRNSKIIEYGQIETNYPKKSNRKEYQNWLESNKKLLDSLKSKEEIRKEALAKSVKYQGLFSTSAKKNMRRAIDIMIQSNPPRKIFNPTTKKYQKHTLTFLTLTIPTGDELTPNYCNKNLLQPLLDWLRKSHQLKTYIWKLEYQKRKQIHYHLTFPNWIPVISIKEKWNYLLDKNSLMQEYKEKYKNSTPPSVHIGKVKHINNFSEYLEKELIKQVQNENDKQKIAIENYKYIAIFNEENKDKKNFKPLPNPKPLSFKIWDCSLDIKSSKYFTLDQSEDLDINIKNATAIYFQDATFNKLEHCTIFNFREKYIQNVLQFEHKKEYDIWLNNIKNFKRKSKENKPAASPPTTRESSTLQ